MKAEYQVSDPEKTDELKDILLRFNPFKENIESKDAYLYLSSCLYGCYFCINKEDGNGIFSSFLKDILSSCDKEVQEQILFEVLNIFDKWDFESNKTKVDEITMNRIKTYAKENRERKRKEFYRGMAMGLLVMFLVMLKVILEIR